MTLRERKKRFFRINPPAFVTIWVGVFILFGVGVLDLLKVL